MKKRVVEIDWSAVECAMRRCITGRSKDGDSRLCDSAYGADKRRYVALHRHVREEEFRAEREKLGGKR